MVEKYHILQEPREIYFFKDGATIFWNVPKLERNNVLKFLHNYEISSYDRETVEEELECLSYSYAK